MFYQDPIHYVNEKTTDAVSSLVLGKKPLRERLLAAAMYSLGMLSNRKQPENLERRYKEIMFALTQNGSFSESIDELEDREVDRIVELILSYAYAVEREFGKMQYIYESNLPKII